MNKQEIGKVVANQRAEKQITQNQLAENIGIRRQSIIEIEQNQFNYRVDRLLEVLEGLGLELLIVKKEKRSEEFVFKGVSPLPKNFKK